MHAPSGPPRNSFQETLSGLQYRPRPAEEVDLFSKACVEQYEEADFHRYGYLFAQVFEPDVLREVALLDGVAYDDLAEVRLRPTPALQRLAGLVDDAADLPTVALVNLAAALISVSRFGPAGRVLAEAGGRAGDPRDVFETAMLEFVIANRCDDAAGSGQAFRRMAGAIRSGVLPPDRTMDACTQAVVWYLKRREVAADEFSWFLSVGRELTRRPDRLDPASVSSWYRGLAMLPAAQREVGATRRYMEYAREAAEQTLSRRPRAYELHLLKTYHESSLKEHMFLTGNFDRAEESGRALIALDPVWAPSYGELAEAYVRFGRTEQAAACYEQAVGAGPPYLGHHLLKAAECRSRAGDPEAALTHYRRLADLAPHNPAVLQAGLDVARTAGHRDTERFASALARLGSGR